MGRQHHYLEIDDYFFNLIKSGVRKFEIRKNDRTHDYKKNDMVYFKETIRGRPTGRVIGYYEIKYIFKGAEVVEVGLQPGYCVFNW